MSGGYRLPDGTIIDDENQTSKPAEVPVDSPCGSSNSNDNDTEDQV